VGTARIAKAGKELNTNHSHDNCAFSRFDIRFKMENLHREMDRKTNNMVGVVGMTMTMMRVEECNATTAAFHNRGKH
jgi:hypothetical protein